MREKKEGPHEDPLLGPSLEESSSFEEVSEEEKRPREELREDSIVNLDDLLIQKFEKALHKATQSVVEHDIAKIAAEHSPIDLAFAAPRLPPYARAVLFENITHVEEKIQFIINTDSSTRIAIFREIEDKAIIALIEKMPPDEAVEVLEDLSERRYRKVIEELDPIKAMRILEIEKNARNTAGRLMTNEFFAFSMEITIGEVAVSIRNNPGIDLTRRIFVLDQEGELQGYVPARYLIINPPELPLKQVMRPVLHKVTVDVSREEVVEIVERYKISALPVVDERQCLIGVITYEDVLDVLEDILDETIGSVAGTTEKVSGYESTFERFASRSPWLLVTLCAGLINVGVMSSFEGHAKGMFTFVLFFVPLITGMSGNLGIQCSTVLVRSMALGFLTPGNRKETILKELTMGMLAALIFGILCGVLVYMAFLLLTKMGIDVGFAVANSVAQGWLVGLIVGVGLCGACFTGTLLGVASPFFFSRFGIDPAVASGPIVTAINDFLSMSIYFLIALGLSSLIL